MKVNKKFIIVFVILFCLVFSLDMITKHFTDGVIANFLNGFIGIVSQHNTGAAWSIFSGQGVFLIITAIIFIAVFVFLNNILETKTCFIILLFHLLL
jgi:lipoprotein signal peptidase